MSDAQTLDEYNKQREAREQGLIETKPSKENNPVPAYHETPTAKQIEETGKLQPITANEQALKQVVGGSAPKWEAMKAWRRLPNGPEKVLARDNWYQRFYGADYETVKKENIFQQVGRTIRRDQPGISNPSGMITAFGKGALDFGFDVVGHLGPAGEKIDDNWDAKTSYLNPTMNNLSRFGSIALPSFVGGAVAGQLFSKAPWAARGLGLLATDVAVTGIADISEEDDTLTSQIVKAAPGAIGPDGWIPVPGALINKDDDTPTVRTWRNQLESVGLMGLGNLIGYSIVKGIPMAQAAKKWIVAPYKDKQKKVMQWFISKDPNSNLYKQQAIAKAADPNKIIRIAEIDSIVASKQFKSPKQKKQLLLERTKLVEDLDLVGGFDQYMKRIQSTMDSQSNAAAVNKIKANPNSVDFDPDITKGVSPSQSRQSVPPGNVARNIADTTNIGMGKVDYGDPAPLMTTAFRNKILATGSSRDGIIEILEQARKAGQFDYFDGLIKTSRAEADAFALKMFDDIINARSGKEVSKLFIDKRSGVRFAESLNLEPIGEDVASAVLAAWKELQERYIGLEVAQSSARVMDTLGKEVSTLAEGIGKFEGVADKGAVQDLIIEKLGILHNEYRLNQKISGLLLQRKKANIDGLLKKDDVLELQQLFKQEEIWAAEDAANYLKLLRNLKETNPEMLDPMMRAFEMTKGDVDTIDALRRYMNESVDPRGIVQSPDPKKLNAAATTQWSVAYNNMLSGLSTFKATVGQTVGTFNETFSSLISHAVMKGAGDQDALKRWMYYYWTDMETNKRQLKYMHEIVKKVHKDPSIMAKLARKDFILDASDDIKLLDSYAKVAEKEDNIGWLVQYNKIRLDNYLANSPWARYAMTGMTGIDSFGIATQATRVARVQAWAEVLEKKGKVDPQSLMTAEKKAYDKLKNPRTGIIDDESVKAFAGEIALNTDDGLATWINTATTAFPGLKAVMAFARSSAGMMKMASSYTPLANIVGFGRYRKVLWARTDDDMKRALAELQINWRTTDNWKAVFKFKQQEYWGRVAYSNVLAGLLMNHGLTGNITGNGHWDGRRRAMEFKSLHYKPKMIRDPITKRWWSYEGIPGVEQVLGIVGDLSYYARDIDSPILEDFQQKLMWTITANFLSESPLQGIEPLTAIATGDFSGYHRLTANTARMFVPASGLQSTLSQSISDARRQLNDDIIDHVKNRSLGFNLTLPEAINRWTGKPINDVNNPILRIFNSLSPVKTSDPKEDWEIWLSEIGYRGEATNATRTADGKYEYNAEEQAYIDLLVGSQEPWKKLIPLMKSKKYQYQTGLMRAHTAAGDDARSNKVSLAAQNLPVFEKIDAIMKEAQENAERFLIKERPDIFEGVKYQHLMNQYIKQGRVDDARQLQTDLPGKQQEVMKKNFTNFHQQ